MTRYQLFSEYSDAVLWGTSLEDALLRTKELHPKPTGSVVDDGHTRRWVADEIPPLKIAKVLGMRNTHRNTRGSWPYIEAVVELEDGKIIEVDARVTDTLPSNFVRTEGPTQPMA